MNALFLLVLTSVGYLIAYHTYGKFLAKRIFRLKPNREMPSKKFEDGEDFVPAQKGVIFGHHFTSIAGTGPIVGPAIGVIWGWGPALIWVFLGSIFMGAFHDFAALVMSIRNEGQSISELTAKYINRRVRTMFFLIVFLALLIVIAIFGLVIAIIFAMFPQSILAIWAQVPIAIALGWIVFKRGGDLKFFTMLAVVIMYITVLLGHYVPFTMPSYFGIPPTGVWTILLLGYAYVASILPVTTLLQPRDYINAWQLFIALGLIAIGIVVSGLSPDFVMAAPFYNPSPVGAPPILPFLFITIACGAISGFHCLVASGTSSKQLKCESDALFVGYGSMLIEGLLATIVIIAVTAGIGMAYDTGAGSVLTGIDAWRAYYSSWTAVAGLGSKIHGVVIGCANMMGSLGIAKPFGIAIIGVFIASFAGTTLDTSTRIQRYVVTELFRDTRFHILSGKHAATAFAVITAAALAFSSGADGKGALLLWPLFGAVNQLLGALALMVATMYLKSRGGAKYLFAGIPCIFMLVMTLWATIVNQLTFFNQSNLILSALNGVILILAIFIAIETSRVFLTRVKRSRS
ncbi:carbon starvation protein A [bacterium]|jgi:carbon starvation protein|nr:carbon starvation protein A [bacterium]